MARLDIQLDSDVKGSGRQRSKDQSIQTAALFLERHQLAKIVAVVDTHCLPDGDFIWAGNDANSYAGCTLDEV